MTAVSRTSGDDQAYRGSVPPLGPDVRRPLWSVMIPTYNAGAFLEQALQSVLDQDPGPAAMHVEVVDDHSTEDDPEQVVRRLGSGRVEFHRQPENVGVVANLNACLRRSRGRLVHVLHGDDFVLPGFYSRMGDILTAHGDVGAAYCRHVYVDEAGAWLSIAPLDPPVSGTLVDPARFLGAEQRIMTPCIVVRRAVYEAAGGFDSRLRCSEDWELWMRIASRFPIYYEQQPLACYRMHPDSNTGRNVPNAVDLEHTRRAIELFSRYFDPHVANEIRRRARRTYARSALTTARRLAAGGDRAGMCAQLRVAWRLSKSPVVGAGILGVGATALAERARARVTPH